MKTITTKLYSFNELNKNAQKVAIREAQKYACEYGYSWQELAIEDIKVELEQIGITDSKVMFTGFNSQGDGACFTCDNIDVEKLMKHLKIWSRYKILHKQIRIGDVNAHISHSGRYCHENSATLYVGGQIDATVKQSRAMQELEEILEQWRYNKSIEIYNRLGVEYEDMTSAEAIRKNLEREDNEVYLINGEIA